MSSWRVRAAAQSTPAWPPHRLPSRPTPSPAPPPRAGVRLFEREEAKGCQEGCGFRCCQAGLHHLVHLQRRQRAACEVGVAARLLQAARLLSPAELERHAPALAAALRATCQPGSVVLSCAAADGLPLHLVALYAPSGGLGCMIKPLERRALLARLLGAAAPAPEGAPREESGV